MTAPEPISTSLGKLSEHDWEIMRSQWHRGVDWNVKKVGKRHWLLAGDLGKGFPLFKTKRAAYEAGETLIGLESRHRTWLRQTKGNQP